MCVVALKILSLSAVETAIGSECASPFMDILFKCLSDPHSKQTIALVLKVLADHNENADWAQPAESDLMLINTVTRLVSVEWILQDSATLFSVCKWICQAFCLTCHLSSRPVRVDRLIEILCNLAASPEAKFQAAASTMALRLSFDSDSKNLSILVRIALIWLLPGNTNTAETTLTGSKRSKDRGEFCRLDGESATTLLLAAAKNVDICRSLLSPQEGYLKQLLPLGCFACTSTHVPDKQRLAATELLRTLACMSSDWNFSMLGTNGPERNCGDPLRVTHWEQFLVQRAFSLAFLDLPTEVISTMRKRLFRPCDHFTQTPYVCRPSSSCISHLVSLTQRFAKTSLSSQSLISKLTSPSATVAWRPSSLFSSQQSFDQALLSGLVKSVVQTEAITDGIRAARLCARIQLLLKYVFRAVHEPHSDECAFKAWLADRPKDDNTHPTSYLSFRLSGVQKQECGAFVHLSGLALIVDPGQTDSGFVQLPIQTSVLFALSPFFEVLLSQRWGANVARDGAAVVLSDKPNCALWPLFPFLIILHLTVGCEWRSCGFLRAFLLPSAACRAFPSDHVAELLGLADRLMLLLEANPDDPSSSAKPSECTFLFRLQCCVLCSLVCTVLTSQEMPHSSSIVRNLFITCLRLSAHLQDSNLFTAVVWLAFTDSRWVPSEASINNQRNLLNRPLAYCLYALLQFRPFGGQDNESNLCSSVASSLDKILFKLLRGS
ncbi:unnamed protein product [Dibothriocephalus latus]|uniref:BTB domain-containing protein n=1 Tax=Dibothriocephalus latus TaxID=60516 RepID=A0A3P6TS27_DIBLA|nr:unnamed protein product [Dibothriocephalus latus]